MSESTFSPDGRYFAAPVPGNGISVWETADGRETARFQTSGEAVQIAIGTTGSYAAVMDSSGRVTILDRTSRQERLLMQGYADRAIVSHSLAFSPDESRLAIGIATDPGGPQPVEVWDVASARRLHVFPARNHIETLAFLPDGRTLILAGGTTPRIWRLEAPKDPVALAGHNDEAWAAAFSPDGKVLATGSDDTDECQTIKLWDPDSGRLRSAWKGHSATVAALAFSPDGRILASASLSPDERGSDNVILWDAASHRRMGSLKGHTNRVRSVAFSPDGRWLATASDDMTARLWDVAKRTTRAILSGHTKNLIGLAFSPDGRWLASSSNDATVRLWDVATGIGLAILPDVNNVNAVAFARWVAAGFRQRGWRDQVVGPCHGKARPVDSWRGGSASLLEVLSGRAERRGGRQRKSHPDLGRRHRPGTPYPGRTRGPDQRPGVLTRWLDPRLVRPRWSGETLAHGPIQMVPTP